MKLSIFTTCRSFLHSKFGLIQRNAIGSWLQLQPRPQIMVMGIDPGSKEICEELGIIHIPDIQLNEFGTPLLGSMFTEAEKRAESEVLALVSSDIILFDDVPKAAEILLQKFPNGFVGGVRRWDKNVEQLIDYSDPDWVAKHRRDCTPGHPAAGDFFLFKKGTYVNGVLPFSVGRASADNWLVHEAMRLGCCVDLTRSVTIIHQMHDHSHIPGDMDGMVNGPEFRKNRDLVAGGVSSEISHTDWIMIDGQIVSRSVFGL